MLLEHIVNLYDVRMVQSGYELCLLDELSTEFFNEFPAARCPYRNLGSISIPVAIVFHKELLDCNLAMQRHLFRFVSNPEASLTENLLNPVFPALECGSC